MLRDTNGYNRSTSSSFVNSNRRWQIAPRTDTLQPAVESSFDGIDHISILDIPESLSEKAQKQLEYYFSDENLRNDRFLLARVGAQGDGFISTADFRNFKRLIVMVSDVMGLSVDELVLAGAARSPLLQASEDGRYIRRNRPLPEPVAKFAKDGLYVISGKIPNLYWCAVPYGELRCQGKFTPLPPVPEVELQGPGTWHWVRQDDPLWEELHWGVLTARHLRGILCFDEPQTAAYFKLPEYMVSHRSALHVYHHLQDALEAAAANPWNLCAETCARNQCSRDRWIFRCGGHDVLIAGARAAMKKSQRSSRARRSCELTQVQCRWGSVHEATALNKFLECYSCPFECLEEVGLCMIDSEKLSILSRYHVEAHGRRWGSSRISAQHMETLNTSFIGDLPPLMGASPDAILRFVDGSRVAVEVKNVCPFFQNGDYLSIYCGAADDERQLRGKVRGPARSIHPNQVPQVQWEMLATGTGYNYFVSASACQGMHVFVVQRDERYLQLMLRLISDFYVEFVQARQPPPADFFWGRPHFHEFLELTQAICARTVISHKLSSMCDAQVEAPFLDHTIA